MGVVFNDAFPWNLANAAINAKDVKRTADFGLKADITAPPAADVLDDDDDPTTLTATLLS
jgi:hypothetical protein